MSKRVIKEGTQYGMISVLNYHGNGQYECRCESCKKVYLVDSRNIGRDKTCRDCFIKRTKKDLSGERFGRLIAKSRTIKIRGGQKRPAWICDCDCGNVITVYTDSLISGFTTSCGCIASEKEIPQAIKDEFVFGTQLSKINSAPTKANKTGVVGVNWDKSRNKWQASLRFQGKKINLGRFLSFDDAVKVRKDAEKEYFGSILKST